ncbi:8-amino-7-oxononanoate synthase (EC [uncultured Gammaproteobacteria bacterium]|jgi:8-amino-7-oxononanoate synthase|nr:8-amino-7-oxononanoate synthase (EC 2.3.1.47) [uncultured Gammaproteobacteria bacterium]CAC9454070.1 8-amino-7-oxononanoate synthase (EC 2.3.1.47) [uncultured Gammaproteobacteria bacterium]CAC9457179.1 8-amino-7-oxononanoate synthase (EC 2.3.1.47) [uncultured Gammaproteobacteria bacterium]VVH65641.1 8-amino-7-oxononanoate synthase (EC [uncultured Gammaproteobacteria bacterium]
MDFSKKLSSLKQRHLYRSRKISENAQNTQLIINGQSLINFCSNDYLSLAKHPKIKQAFKQGVDKHASLIFADNLNSNKVLFTK